MRDVKSHFKIIWFNDSYYCDLNFYFIFVIFKLCVILINCFILFLFYPINSARHPLQTRNGAFIVAWPWASIRVQNKKHLNV